MFKFKHAFMVARIWGKMGLTIDNPEESIEKVGSSLMMQIVQKLPDVEQEFYALVADMKGISAEEAANLNLFNVLQEMASDKDLVSFFKAAVKSKGRA